MTRKPGGKSNAKKHGAYVQEPILTGESEREFKELLESLIVEWAPNGASEEQAVLDLAKYIWAKRRNDRFYYEEASWIEISRWDDLAHMRTIARFLGTAKTLEHAKGLIAYLPEKCQKYVFADSGGDDAENEIRLLTQHLQECLELEGDFLLEPSHFANAKTAAALRELTEKKIALDGRLDSQIDKTIKRLAQLKTLKQVIAMQTSTTKITDARKAPRLVSLKSKDRAA